MDTQQPETPPERRRITFLGHSSALISMNGLNVLTDPNFSRHIFFFIRRRSDVPLEIRELPPLDLILISHAHYDHLDLPSLRKLPRDITVIAAPGLGKILKWAKKSCVVSLKNWESRQVGALTVTAVPARHFAGRHPLFPLTGYQGYVLEGDATVYFAGDSALFGELYDIGRNWEIDVALLPIGAYEPPSFRRHHMSPEDAVEACRRLRAKILVPIHWGTFKLSLEPFDEPVARLKRAAQEARLSSAVKVLLPGQSLVIHGKGANESVEIV